MATKDPNRESYFPSIEKKYGEPMSYWFGVTAGIADQKYLEQVAYLRTNYGFTHAHANALVMYSRGSKSSQRFNTPSDYFKSLDRDQAKTVRAIFKAITTKYPDLELVIAWNQPMLRSEGKYIFGVSVAKNHILMAPWSKDVIQKFTPKMKDLVVNKKTIGVPNDWKVDEKLLQAMTKTRMAELK